MKVLGSLLMALWWGSSSVTASRSGPPKNANFGTNAGVANGSLTEYAGRVSS
jgi:hypothetical protein